MLSAKSKKYFKKINLIKYYLYKLNPNIDSLGELIVRGTFPRPHYALGMFMSCLQAKHQGYDKISVIEFGCHNCEGIQDMEFFSKLIEKVLDIKISIYGFDSGVGLPETKDKRDRLYYWQPGDYRLEKNEVKKNIDKAELIIGDVTNTISEFIKKKPDPIAFIAFDLDYYTSTKNSFKLFNNNQSLFITRPILYFDDFIYCSENEGEKLAIKEFNEENDINISPIGELAENLQMFWKKWHLLGKRFYFLVNHNHNLYNKKFQDPFKKFLINH
jgi:hypothetical protein